MRTCVVGISVCLVLCGCTTVRGARILAVATRINNATGALMRLTGPPAVAAYCTVNPPACPAASQIYMLAVGAQREYTAALTHMRTTAEPDAAKLAGLATDFQTRYTELSALTGAPPPESLTEFQTNLHTLREVAVQ